MTPVKDLVIGDMVLSDKRGIYTKYYLKGHHHEDIKTEFIRLYPVDILTNPIQLSPGHMIYKAAYNLPISASSIKIGDVLTTVKCPPFQSGITIVVDGIVASIYSI